MPVKTRFQYYLFYCTIFAIAMAYLESAVVVYLRELYYPQGFRFPLAPIQSSVYLTEIGREASTIVMLWAVARLISSNKLQWFAYFAYLFAIWDIFYYFWLKVLLDWPSSLFEWDILFLIPLPWIAPVLAPILVSCTLVIASCTILIFQNKGLQIKLTALDWVLQSIAGFGIIISFTLQADTLSTGGKPHAYAWWLFLSGLFMGILVFVHRFRKINQSISN